MRYIILGALFLTQGATAAESYNPAQAGAWLNLCGGGTTAATCQMYLAGYRAGLQAALRETQQVTASKYDACENNSGKLSKDICNIPSEMLASQMLNGCKEQGKKLGANVVHQMLVNYLEKNPKAKELPFTDVYKNVMFEIFPCDK